MLQANYKILHIYIYYMHTLDITLNDNSSYNPEKFGSVVFNSIYTLLGYLMPNPVFIYDL